MAPRWLTHVAACGAVVVLGCSAEQRPSPPQNPTTDEGGIGVEIEAAQGVVLDVRDNGRRLLVRNESAEEILVLDTAGQPEREERSGVLTLTYVRPGGREGDGAQDAPELFEAVAVPARGETSIEPPFALRPGQRLRYCLEVMAAAAAIGGDMTRVGDRRPTEPASVACSKAFTVT